MDYIIFWILIGVIICVFIAEIFTIKYIISMMSAMTDKIANVSSQLIMANRREEDPQKTPSSLLTYTEIEEVIDSAITELWSNKYLMYYTIRQLKVIPNMDTEIEKFVAEIFDGFSGTQLYTNILMYYNEGYLVRMITRRVQLLMMEYISKNKPKSK